ncbi:hypothetical protein Avbf_17134 [Armadillidium vulgare]|nr:hypothetical protein Avbf_17134 [Armadillidium vulgare]
MAYNTYLCLKDLSKNICEKKLYDKFQTHCKVRSVLLCRIKYSMESFGCAVVIFENIVEARKAYIKYNNEVWYGLPLKFVWPEQLNTPSFIENLVFKEYTRSDTGENFRELDVENVFKSLYSLMRQSVISNVESSMEQVIANPLVSTPNDPLFPPVPSFPPIP